MLFANLKKKLFGVVFEEDTTHHIAMCFSIGLFFGFIPLLGLQFFPLLAIIFIFRMNKAATLAGQFMLNTFTFPFVYAFNFIVGTAILGEDIGIIFNAKGMTWAYLASIYRPLFVGCMIMGIICSAAAYFIIKSAVRSYRVKYKSYARLQKVLKDKKLKKQKLKLKNLKLRKLKSKESKLQLLKSGGFKNEEFNENQNKSNKNKGKNRSKNRDKKNT